MLWSRTALQRSSRAAENASCCVRKSSTSPPRPSASLEKTRSRRGARCGGSIEGMPGMSPAWDGRARVRASNWTIAASSAAGILRHTAPLLRVCGPYGRPARLTELGLVLVQAGQDAALADRDVAAQAVDLGLAVLGDFEDGVRIPGQHGRRLEQRELAFAADLVAVRRDAVDQAAVARGNLAAVLLQVGLAGIHDVFDHGVLRRDLPRGQQAESQDQCLRSYQCHHPSPPR